MSAKDKSGSILAFRCTMLIFWQAVINLLSNAVKYTPPGGHVRLRLWKEAAQVIAEGKPEKIADKIVEGKLQKFYEEVCLIKQKFIKDTNITVEDLIKASIAATGENILVKRFVRYQLGGDEAADNAL